MLLDSKLEVRLRGTGEWSIASTDEKLATNKAGSLLLLAADMKSSNLRYLYLHLYSKFNVEGQYVVEVQVLSVPGSRIV